MVFVENMALGQLVADLESEVVSLRGDSIESLDSPVRSNTLGIAGIAVGLAALVLAGYGVKVGNISNKDSVTEKSDETQSQIRGDDFSSAKILLEPFLKIHNLVYFLCFDETFFVGPSCVQITIFETSDEKIRGLAHDFATVGWFDSPILLPLRSTP